MTKIINLKYVNNNKIKILNIQSAIQMLNENNLEKITITYLINCIVKGGAKYGLHS